MCQISSYQWGGVPAILNIICMFIRHESEAQSLSPHYDKKIGKHFSIPSVPSPFVPVSSPGWRVCPHFCWDNLLEYPDFPSLIRLWPNSKKPWVLKTSEFFFFKKNPEFWKISEFKKKSEFWKHLTFFKKKTLSFEKIWVKKNREFLKNGLSFKKCFKIKKKIGL